MRNSVTSVRNSVTPVCNSVTPAHSSQCLYFPAASKECYALKLHVWMDKRVAIFMEWYNVSLMLCNAVTLRNKFLHLVTLSQTVLVTRCSSRWGYNTCLCLHLKKSLSFLYTFISLTRIRYRIWVSEIVPIM